MKVIVCLDDKNGMLFNGRRQSQDRVLRANLLKRTAGFPLRMNAYSKKQFTEEDAGILVDEDFLSLAQTEDFCFVENLDIKEYEDRMKELFIYRWNREYPGDFFFPFDAFGWRLEETEEFAGSSHEKITLEHYVRK